MDEQDIVKIAWLAHRTKLLFTRSTMEQSLLDYLITKILLLKHNLFEEISSSQLLEGTAFAALWLPHWSDSALRKARKGLVDKTIIFYEPNTRISFAPALYYINIPGMLVVWRNVFDRFYEFYMWHNEWKPAAERIKEEWNKRKYPLDLGISYREDDVERIEDSLLRATERRSQRDRERKVKDAKKPLTAKMIPVFLKECCEDVGSSLKYNDDWTKKLYGQAKNWLTACERSGINPRKRLRELCKRWDLLLEAHLKNDAGMPINLTTTISFDLYYKYRRQIDSWIIDHTGKDMKGKYKDLKVISLKTRKHK